MALASSVPSLSPAWFPVPSFQIPVLSSTVGFLSPFPDSLPQLFLRCLPYAFAFGLSPSASLSFVRSTSGSGYSASVSSFPLSSRPRLSAACPVRPLRFRFPGFPRSFQPGFPCLLSRLFVLGFLSVSFRPSLIRSHSRSSGAYLLLSLSVFPLPLRFLSSASLPVLATQPLFLPFLFLPVSVSQRLPRCCLSAFRLPCFSASAPPGFPCFAFASSYSAFCSFPFILPGFAPTAVPPVLPFRLASSRPLPVRAFPSLRFLSSASARF